jgi:4a-hydroxytetrahydrobiopterin dehydratase
MSDAAPELHPGWRRDGESLVRELTFRDFEAAHAFVDRLAQAAVDYQRRPDLCILWTNHVRIVVANLHDAGITLAELRLAAKVDAFLEADGGLSAR